MGNCFKPVIEFHCPIILGKYEFITFGLKLYAFSDTIISFHSVSNGTERNQMHGSRT